VQTIDRRRFNTGLFLGFGLSGCAQIEPGQPDLVVTALRWSEDDGATWHTGPIQAGRNVLFECDVLNQGTGPTLDGVIIGVAFIVDNVYVSWSDDHSTALPSGATVSLRANGGPDGDRYWNNVQAGSYTIRAHVDDVNRIPNELDETNNTLDVPLVVSSATGLGQLPVYAASGAVTDTGTLPGPHSVVVPTPVNAGDLLVLQCIMRTNNGNGLTTSVPNGWTALPGNTYNGSNFANQSLFWRIADGGEAGMTVAVSASGGGLHDRFVGVVHRFTAADGFDDMPVAAFSSLNGSNGVLAAPTVVPTGLNQLAVCVGAMASQDATIGGFVGESGGTWVEVFNHVVDVGWADVTANLQVSDQSAGSQIGGGTVAFDNTSTPQWTTVGFVLVPTGSVVGVQARQADALVDSIAVNTHFTHRSYINNFTSGADLKQKLHDLGIRHIRDGVETGASGYAARLAELYNDLGIKATLIVNNGPQQRPTAAYTWIQNNIGFEAIAAMEGLNEPAVFHGGQNYTQIAYDLQVELWNTFRVNGVATAQAVPIYSCSPTSRDEADAHKAYGEARTPWPQLCDGGNCHPYPGGRHPETTGWGSRDPEGDYNYGALFYNMQSIGEEVGGVGRPQLAGETGYQHPPASTQQVPESVGAIYVPRLYLYYYGRGLPSGANVVRTAYYALLDDDVLHFKLVNTNGTTTAAYNALRNLITLLNDPGEPFTPSFLKYEFSGSLANVYDVLLQKRDGVFYIALWLGRQLWNPDTQQPTTVDPQSVTLTFNQPVTSIDQVFPNEGTTWGALAVTNNQVALLVEPRVMLLRVVAS
jgi:hypothetical protein